jgi:hypothetical protein
MRNALRGIEAVEAVEFPSGERRRLHIPSGGAWGLTVASIPVEAGDLIAAAPRILAAIQARYQAIKAAFDAPHTVRQSSATKTAVFEAAGRTYEAHSTYGNRSGWGGFILESGAFDDLLPSDADGPYIVNLG